MSARGRSLLALGVGLIVLGGGIAVGLLAHDDGPRRTVTADPAEQARLERLIQEAESRPPRFDASIVEIPLADLPVLTDPRDGNAPYQLVETPVAKRVRTDTDSLRPDLGTLPHPPYLDRLASLVRERKFELRYTRVVALLVRQRVPGDVSGFRMQGRAFDVVGYAPILDPTDVMGTYTYDRRGQPKRRPVELEWTPRPGTQGALVPLLLMHYLDIVPGRETPELRSTLFDVNAVMTGNVTAPEKLTFERPGGRVMTVPIANALNEPLLLDARGGA